MTRPALAALALAAAAAAPGCALHAYRPASPLTDQDLPAFLAQAVPDPADASSPVVALVVRVPGEGRRARPPEIYPVEDGRLPPWTAQPVAGLDALGRPGRYVGVFSVASGRIHFLAPVADPRDVLGESLAPVGSAQLARLDGGTSSLRVPFVPGSAVVVFEVGPGQTTRIEVSFAFGSSFPHFEDLWFLGVRP